MSIRIKDLRVTLGDREVIRGVDLEVQPGETLALMGASGSGKSTLLRAAVGLLRIDTGEVWLFGENINGASNLKLRIIRKRIGMLFQGNALFDSMTVRDNIGVVLREVMGMSIQKISPRVKELLTRLRLGQIGKMWPAQLSGGMKKRVGIARAVAHSPEMILYDDPTAGLDPITSDVIADLIAELGADKKVSAIVVSNYLPLIMKVADRVALLHRGKIINLGPPKSIWESDRPGLRMLLGGGMDAKGKGTKSRRNEK